jgi:hypothetical protein
MVVRRISRSIVKERPYEVWNAFVNLIAFENYADLDAVQRPAHLCFWYDSQVQNGGHLQYFENRGTVLLAETLAALKTLGAECQFAVLETAGHLYASRQRKRIETREEYVVTAKTGEFDDLDAAYYACQPSMQALLRQYLERHRECFVEISDDRIGNQ